MSYAAIRILTLLAMTLSAASIGCSRSKPPVVAPEIRYLPSPSLPCLRSLPSKACTDPELTTCSLPNDMSPGSCQRLNIARTLDAYAICGIYIRMAVAVCKVPERVQ